MADDTAPLPDEPAANPDPATGLTPPLDHSGPASSTETSTAAVPPADARSLSAEGAAAAVSGAPRADLPPGDVGALSAPLLEAATLSRRVPPEPPAVSWPSASPWVDGPPPTGTPAWPVSGWSGAAMPPGAPAGTPLPPTAHTPSSAPTVPSIPGEPFRAIAPVLPPVNQAVAPRRGRRRLAFAVGVTAAVAAGAAGGYVAADRSAKPAQSAASVAAGAGATTPTAAKPATDAQAVSLPVVTPGVAMSVADLVEKAMPSVVSLNVQGSRGDGAGTGFVISADGQIATNAHVVAGADKISIEFQDGSTADAKVVGIDEIDDLAVVKVDRQGLRALPFGSSEQLRVGEPVVAIGNALALTGAPTATQGIISSIDRSIDTNDGGHLGHVLQTDAAINPGNSGGPLLTLDGRVVGINSAGSASAQSVGFAIASDVAVPILDQLRQGREVVRPYLGVSTRTLDPTVAASNGLPVEQGALVVDVGPGSAAAKAGLQAGDVIVKAGGTDLTDDSKLRDAIRTAGVGNPLELVVNRDGKEVTLTATLGTRPS